jgi:hypothetical protein
MALSVSCWLGTEVSVPDSNRLGKAGSRRRGSGDLRVCWMRGSRAECAVGSGESGADDSAEGSRIRVAGSIEGANVDKDVPAVSALEEEAILVQPFLVQGLLCGHGRVGCGHDAEVYPLSGEDVTPVRAAATVRLGAGPCPPTGGGIKAALFGCGFFTNRPLLSFVEMPAFVGFRLRWGPIRTEKRPFWRPTLFKC